MAKKLSIGIIGCGAIGTSLAHSIKKDFASVARVAALYDTDIKKAQRLSAALVKRRLLAVDSLGFLIKKSRLVIECAHAQSSWEIAQKAIRAKRDLMIMSVGGVLSEYTSLCALAKRHKVNVFLPSGALCGIDGLKALALGRIQEVTLITSKNPLSFKGNAYFESKYPHPERMRNDTVVFKGSAQEATRHFPQNINVAAILSLAGIGASRTQVEIVANPAIKKNVHEVRIIAEAGQITTRTENILHPDNPKTSYLAVLSAVACLKQIFSSVRVGT